MQIHMTAYCLQAESFATANAESSVLVKHVIATNSFLVLESSANLDYTDHSYPAKETQEVTVENSAAPDQV